MWFTFALAVIACVAALYIPGFFAGRALRLSKFSTAVAAPAFSLFIFAVLGIVLRKAQFSCSGLAFFAIALAAALALFAISFGAAQTAHARTINIAGTDAEAAVRITALYVAVALVMTTVVFLFAIDSPESFSRNDDTTVHLNVVRAFLDTGTCSTLAANSFLDQSVEGSFYPATWHIVAAIVASVFGNNVMLATNAMIVVVLSFVTPIGFSALMIRTFGSKARRNIVLSGALVALAFSGFPWGFVAFGQLLPNTLSFSLIPLALLLLMSAIDPVLQSRTVAAGQGRRRHSRSAPSGNARATYDLRESRESIRTDHDQDESSSTSKGVSRAHDDLACTRIFLAVALFLALVAIAFSQPNGAFTFGIWTVLYGISRVFYQPDSSKACMSKRSFTVALFILVAACLAWAAAYCAPFSKGLFKIHGRRRYLLPRRSLAV